MWLGVEPLLQLLVLSLPILWIVDWRFSRIKIRSIQLAKFFSYYVLILLLIIVIQGIIGHFQTPLHSHAVLWGVSDSIMICASCSV